MIEFAPPSCTPRIERPNVSIVGMSRPSGVGIAVTSIVRSTSPSLMRSVNLVVDAGMHAISSTIAPALGVVENGATTRTRCEASCVYSCTTVPCTEFSPESNLIQMGV